MTIKIIGKPVFTKDAEIIELLEGITLFFIDFIIKEKDIRPLVQIYDGDEFHVYVAQFANNEQKNSYAHYIYNECLRRNALFVIFVSDTWVVKKSSKKSRRDIERIIESALPASKDPDRTEAIVSSIIYPNGNTDSIHAPYVRNKKGFPDFKTNPAWFDGDTQQMNIIRPWSKAFN